jgi:hypothetical protein
MKLEILEKLKKLLSAGITTEPQVVYFTTAVRKLLEQEQAKQQYRYLTFHCDWALHSELKGAMAQAILKKFDEANLQLKKGTKLQDLPVSLRKEIEQISTMRAFRKELYHFLETTGVPTVDQKLNDWGRFLFLYSKVVEHCPLVLTSKSNAITSVASVTVHLDVAKQPVNGEMFFRVSWRILDKSGQSGDIFVINSFPLNSSTPAV